jgi:transcriptional regulator with XRE-family HTH domain
MAHPVDVHVGRKLKEIRTEQRFSQTDIAQRIGLSFQQVQKYEIGSNRIAASRLFELAQIFDVSPAYFFTGLHHNANSDETRPDSGKDIMRALEQIKDDALKSRIVTFIEDISGMSVSRQS